MMHWIFGYGSLICPDSRARTGLTGEALPVIASGLERHWRVALEQAELSVVGVSQAGPDAQTGGVLFALQEDEFAEFDRREVEYERQPLAPQALQTVDGSALPEGKFWVYQPGPSQSQHPIPQSYLDVILRGCLQINEAFAEHFIRHTGSWKPRINDRQQPLYARPLRPQHQQVWPQVDRLLDKHLPKI